MPSLKPVDESFFTNAPQILTHTWEIDSPADSVWTQLVGDRPLFWCTGLNVRWISSPPFGVGTTRQATVAGLVKVQEHFFIWEDDPTHPYRYAFYGSAVNLPLFNALAEDYIVTPVGEDTCTFTWTIAIEPSLLGKPGTPINALAFGQAFRDTAKHFRAR